MTCHLCRTLLTDLKRWTTWIFSSQVGSGNSYFLGLSCTICLENMLILNTVLYPIKQWVIFAIGFQHNLFEHSIVPIDDWNCKWLQQYVCLVMDFLTDITDDSLSKAIDVWSTYLRFLLQATSFSKDRFSSPKAIVIFPVPRKVFFPSQLTKTLSILLFSRKKLCWNLLTNR